MASLLVFLLRGMFALLPIGMLAQDYVYLGESFYIKNRKSGSQCLEVYYNSQDNKKLNGNFRISFSAEGYVFATQAGFKRGRFHGKRYEYKNDTLETISFYKMGVKEGIEYRFWDTRYGKWREESTCREGRKHGVEKEFRNDSLCREVQFVEGMKSGKEDYHNRHGEVSANAYYSFEPFAFPPEISEKQILLPFGDSLPASYLKRAFTFKGKLEISAATSPGVQDHDDGFYIGSETLVYDAIELAEGCALNGEYPGFYYWIEYSYGSFDTLDGDEDWLVLGIFNYPYRLVHVKLHPR